MLFLLTLLPYLPADTKVKADEELKIAIAQLAPQAAEVISGNLNSLLKIAHTGLLSVGIAAAVFAASGGMNMTMAGLDKCYDVVKPRAFWKQRLLAIGLTVIVATMIIAVLILLPIGSAVEAVVLKYQLFGLSRQMVLL